MKEFYGRLILGLNRILQGILEGIIILVSFVVQLLSGIGRMMLLFFSFGGCLLFFSPWLILFLDPRIFVMTVLVFFLFGIVPILGTGFVSWLQYKQYILDEFLEDYGRFYLGERGEYQSYRHFEEEYRKKQAEYFRKEQEKRRQQEEFWRAQFNEWSQQSQRQSSGAYGTTYNPQKEFIEKYESSCRILQLPYETDQYQVKLNYRKLAKKYHPDLNPDPHATEEFQKINAAFEFLSADNIKRYQDIRRTQ